MRDVRHCPDCGAYRGFACNATMNPKCPQLAPAPDAQAELDALPNWTAPLVSPFVPDDSDDGDAA
jgi:hypothetical protein